MSDPYAALVPFGWSDRVRALWNELERPVVSPGRVVRVERGACVVACHDGVERTARSPSQVAVGDWVALDESGVRTVLPRWSELARMDPARSGGQAGVQVLASNVDVVVITVPIDRLRPARVERELAIAWESGARPLVALTKTDLGDPAEAAAGLAGRLVGVNVVATSARDGLGLPVLGAELAGRTGILFGPSGAGKSSLLNALVGETIQTVATVRDADGRGRHTTTSRQLVCLPDGGVIIDTPGVRSLALASEPDVEEVFPEIDALARRCRFNDCRHGAEPGCAVAQAVGDGTLDARRLASFQKLVREAAAERRKTDPLARREAQRVWKRRARDARRYDKRTFS